MTFTESVMEAVERALPSNCTNCRQKLKRIKWNTKCDILLCDNADCAMYHAPQGTVEVPKRTMDETNFKENNYDKRGRGRQPKRKGEGWESEAERGLEPDLPD